MYRKVSKRLSGDFLEEVGRPPAMCRASGADRLADAVQQAEEAADDAAQRAFQRVSDEADRAEAASRASHRASEFAILSAVVTLACAAGWFAPMVMSFLR